MRRILLVDDDTEFREGLLRRFRPHRQEWQVATAGNGSEALRLAREQSFDLVITDILMPEKDGIETVIAFKRAHPSAKIVAISGGGRHVGTEPLCYARQLGADATLEKPFAFDSLQNVIRALLVEQDLDSTPTMIEVT